jgi:cytochrome P450
MPVTNALNSGAHVGRQRHSLAHLPGEDGWPIVGNTLRALKDPVAHIHAMHGKHGAVYRDHLFGVRSVAMLGPEANEHVLFDRDKKFLFVCRLGISSRSAFPPWAYLGALNDVSSRRISEWHLAGPGQGGTAQLQFYPAFKQLTLDLAAASFLGIELGSQARAVNRAFIDMVAAIIGVVRVPIPGTLMSKGVKGRHAIVAYFTQEIPKRRAGQGTDLFTELCRATKEDGSVLSDQEIADHMSFLMMAAHDTLTSSVTSLVYLLCKHPEWQEQLRREMHGLRLPRGAPLSYERLGELALFEMAFKEAMRINPPVPGIPRAAVRDFRFKGHDIPASTRVAISAIFTHRMSELWPEPLKFDPLRFTDEATRGRHKYAWVQFGGGAHMCLGLHFAYIQAKSFFYHLLTTTRVSLVPDYVPRWQMWPIPKPCDGLPIRIDRIR